MLSRMQIRIDILLASGKVELANDFKDLMMLTLERLKEAEMEDAEQRPVNQDVNIQEGGKL